MGICTCALTGQVRPFITHSICLWRQRGSYQLRGNACLVCLLVGRLSLVWIREGICGLWIVDCVVVVGDEEQWVRPPLICYRVGQHGGPGAHDGGVIRWPSAVFCV